MIVYLWNGLLHGMHWLVDFLFVPKLTKKQLQEQAYQECLARTKVLEKEDKDFRKAQESVLIANMNFIHVDDVMYLFNKTLNRCQRDLKNYPSYGYNRCTLHGGRIKDSGGACDYITMSVDDAYRELRKKIKSEQEKDVYVEFYYHTEGVTYE